jgi:hypothetical protein
MIDGEAAVAAALQDALVARNLWMGAMEELKDRKARGVPCEQAQQAERDARERCRRAQKAYVHHCWGMRPPS